MSLCTLIVVTLFANAISQACNYWEDSNGDRQPFGVCIGIHLPAGIDTSAIYSCHGNEVYSTEYNDTASCKGDITSNRNVTKYIGAVQCNPSYHNCDYIHLRVFSYGRYFGDSSSNNGCDQQNSDGMDINSNIYGWRDTYRSINHCNEKFGFYWQCENDGAATSETYDECDNATTITNYQTYSANHCMYNYGWTKFLPMECVDGSDITTSTTAVATETSINGTTRETVSSSANQSKSKRFRHYIAIKMFIFLIVDIVLCW